MSEHTIPQASRYFPVQYYATFGSSDDFVLFQRQNPTFVIISVTQLVGHHMHDILVVYHNHGN